jgi:transcriptional regulator with XRE-family HTH domain
MGLSERILEIIKDNHLNQKEFAKSLNVTQGFISRLLKDGTGLSNSTAMLIEKIYGYSKDWVLEGKEPKKADIGQTLSPLQRNLITEIQKMTDIEIHAVHSYIRVFRQSREKMEFEKKE